MAFDRERRNGREEEIKIIRRGCNLLLTAFDVLVEGEQTMCEIKNVEGNKLKIQAWVLKCERVRVMTRMKRRLSSLMRITSHI